MEMLKTALIFLLISCMSLLHTQAKVTTLHFYVQDVRSGPNTTVFNVASASITSTSPSMFGAVNVLDDKMTAGPELNSEEIGRVQGLTTSADLQVRGLTFIFNYVFTSGKYKGSTFTAVGRNPLLDKQRELSVVGGTGAFRFVRGYAISTTYLNDVVNDITVIENYFYLTLAYSDCGPTIVQ